MLLLLGPKPTSIDIITSSLPTTPSLPPVASIIETDVIVYHWPHTPASCLGGMLVLLDHQTTSTVSNIIIAYYVITTTCCIYYRNSSYLSKLVTYTCILSWRYVSAIGSLPISTDVISTSTESSLSIIPSVTTCCIYYRDSVTTLIKLHTPASCLGGMLVLLDHQTTSTVT